MKRSHQREGDGKDAKKPKPEDQFVCEERGNSHSKLKNLLNIDCVIYYRSSVISAVP